MFARVISLWLFLLACTTTLTSASDDFEVKGRVVDQQGRPAAGVSVATNWSANGKWFKSDGAPIYDLSDPDQQREYSRQAGKMEPLSHQDQRTDSEGMFRIKVHSRASVVLAMNDDRSQGGLATIPAPYDVELLEIRLEPLICVHAKLTPKDPKTKSAWTNAIVELAEIPMQPLAFLRIADCSSFISEGFEFKLPPGKYRFDIYGQIAGAAEDDFNLGVRQRPEVTLTADKLDVDLGTFELTDRDSVPRRRKAAIERGAWRDYTEHYGEEPPEWHVTDARGVPKEVRIADFRGKWLLIDFWGMGCAPCLSRGIPKAVALYEKHAAVRGQFAIVGVCIDWQGEIKSIAQLEKALEPIEKHVWKGKGIPFPIILDSTFQTWERFGIPGLGTVVLISPEGKLVAGDGTTLDAILSERAASQ